MGYPENDLGGIVLSLTIINTLDEEEHARVQKNKGKPSTKSAVKGRNSLRKKSMNRHSKNAKTGNKFGSKRN